MLNIIYFIICGMFFIWAYNGMKLNHLQDRYDKALIEYEYLIEQNMTDSLKQDSLTKILNKIENK
tara:strand:+ start:1470 stop:1664 length:195 start_codon:yes stop_codon:yes gene_type:complete